MGKNYTYPDDGALMAHHRPGDFLDAKAVPLPHPAPDAADLAIAIFFDMPGWAKLLLRTRNAIVSPLGLKTDGADFRPPGRDEILDRTYPGVFAVQSATPREVVFGTDDSHLDFRISVLKDTVHDRVALSTWVRPHNLLGRTYLATIMPFHHLIVARALANAGKLGLTVSR